MRAFRTATKIQWVTPDLAHCLVHSLAHLVHVAMTPVGVSEAARQLGVHPSQIRRNLKSGLIPNRGLPGRPLVDVDEARYARATGLDHSKQRGPSAHVTRSQAAPRSLTNVSEIGNSADEGAGSGTYQSWRARREAAAAVTAEIELAKLRGEVLDRANLKDTAFTLGMELRRSMMDCVAQVAPRLLGLNVGAIIAVLTEAYEKCLVEIADELERRFPDASPEGGRP
jgi:hypothetical protein